MTYKISCLRQYLILTLTPDIKINFGDLCQTELLLNHAMSSSISCIIFDLGSLSSMNTIGKWTLYHLAYQATNKGKSVFLSNVSYPLEQILAESGICEFATFVKSPRELDYAIRSERQSGKSVVQKKRSKSAPRLHEIPFSGYTDFPEIAV